MAIRDMNPEHVLLAQEIAIAREDAISAYIAAVEHPENGRLAERFQAKVDALALIGKADWMTCFKDVRHAALRVMNTQ